MEFGRFHVTRSRKTDLFSIKKEGDFFTYTRGEKVVRITARSFDMDVLPLAPVNLPDKVSPHIMINFDPLLMSGKSRIIIFLKIPAETGVFVDDALIDVIGDDGFKYILYGPPSGGYVCKNLPSERVEKKGIRGDGKSLYVPLRIKNYTDRAFSVHRALIDTSYLDIYYKGKLAMTEMIKLDITLDGLRVRYLNRSFLPGLKRVKAASMILKKEEAIDMRWGP